MLTLLTRKNIEKAIRHLASDEHFTCDTETYGLGWLDKAFMTGFRHQDGTCYYSREGDKDYEFLIREIIIGTKDICTPVFANPKFDLHRLEWLTGYRFERVHDVIALDHLINPQELTHRLKAIGGRLFGAEEEAEKNAIDAWFIECNDKKKEFWKLPDEILLPYFEQDLVLTNKVFWKLYPQLGNYPKLPELYELEMQVVDVVTRMEKAGVLVDKKYLTKFRAVLEKDQAKLIKELRKGFSVSEDFNFNSSDQLGDLLYNQLGCEVLYTTEKGAPSCNDEALKHIQHPYIESLRAFKLNETYLTKFVDPWLNFSKHDGKLHACFNTMGAVSGRFTCEMPNMQQIMKDPKITRGLMVTPGKVCGHSDLSQIEMVGAAWYTRDDQMLSSLKAGTDLHRDTAANLFNIKPEDVTKHQRQIAKGMNFSVVYGCGKKRLASFLSNHTGVPVPLAEAEYARSMYHSKYPEIRMFSYSVMDTIKRRRDRIIKNYFGRRYFIPTGKEYVGVNRLVQGWAAYVTKYAMARIGPKLNWKTNWMNCQVHDMISWECDIKDQKDVQAMIEKDMTTWPEFDVPIKVDTSILRNTWEA